MAREQTDMTRRLRAYWEANPSKVRVDGLEVGSQAYFDAIRHHHDTSFEASDAMLDLSGLEGARVIDIYCGVGIDAVTAARHGAHAVSVATAFAHADLTRRFARQEGVRVGIVVADPDRLPFANDTFDLVLARGVLMFTPEVEGAVRELRRIQKPHSRFIALMLNRWSWYPLLARFAGTPLVQEPADPPYLRLDSSGRARKLFAGWSELQLMYDRFPRYTAERNGISATLFNKAIVPLFRVLPRWLVRPLGFYLIVMGRKPAASAGG